MRLLTIHKQDTKTCTKCGETKPATNEYFNHRARSTVLESWCKECRKKHKNKYRGRYDDREYNKYQYRPLDPKDLPENTAKTCTKCGETKPANLSNFPQRSRTTYDSWCRECKRKYKRNYTETRNQDLNR